MSPKGFIKFDFSNARKFRRELRAVSRGRPKGPLKSCFRQWGSMYLAETKREFIKNSLGGGDWPELAESTQRARGDKESAAMLRDTNAMFGAMDIGAAGNRFVYIKGGVSVGFGGPAKHPDGSATIADIARFHNEGGGNLPKRQILRGPSRLLVGRMESTLKVAVNRMGNSL